MRLKPLMDCGLQAILTQEAGHGALALGFAAVACGVAVVGDARQRITQILNEVNPPIVKIPMADCLLAFALTSERDLKADQRLANLEDFARRAGWRGAIDTHQDRAVMVDYLLDHLDSPEAQAIVSFFNETPWIRAHPGSGLQRRISVIDGVSVYNPELLCARAPKGATVRDLANACLAWVRSRANIDKGADYSFTYRPRRFPWGRDQLEIAPRRGADWAPCDD